jgi:hypothetical protein
MGMKISVGLALVPMVLGLVAGARAAEIDQIAQSQLIGRSGKSIRACLGKPAKRIPVGDEAIWVYPIGTLYADGLWFFVPLDLNVFRSGAPCEVRFVVNPYGVSQVYYALPGGAAMPLGQYCNFPVENCVPPQIVK